MKNYLRQFIPILLLAYSANSQTTINFTVDVTKPLTPISPYIYGTNDPLTGTEGWKAFRLGGNRLTGYNWENNASNAGSDWFHSSDNFMLGAMGVPNNRYSEPASVSSVFHERSMEYNAYSLMTIQLAGYVAKDMNGTVSQSETAPSPRWVEVKPEKGGSFSLTPDLNDGYVYIDEYVNYNVNKFGNAASGGIHAYSLDNEPALWMSTHLRIHPTQTLCVEITQKGISYAKAVKKVDSTAEVFGPALYGFAAYTDFQGASDWSSVKTGKSYNWFIDYYLDEMKKAGTSEGKRLLDVLDVHWYPEAMGDNRIVNSDANTDNDKNARVQAPRTLWDSQYIENSWIGQWGKAHLPLIPKLKASIDTYYPDTKLAFTEFTYGGPNDISGGIATCDALGIFAKYSVYFASLWPVDAGNYFTSAYKMYTNYDGNNSEFGNQYAYSKTADSVNTSIYGSIASGKNEIHLIVINKNFTDTYYGNFSIVSDKNVIDGKSWYIDESSSDIQQGSNISNVVNNSFTYSLPAASVTHIVLKTNATSDVAQGSSFPTDYRLFAYPNPFNPSCRMDYNIPANDEASIGIYDVTGRLIKSFAKLHGTGNVYWEGRDEKNQQVSSGVYFAIMKSVHENIMSQKLVLLK